MEERKNEEVLYKISPRFSFIYELFMPTGRKIKSTIAILFIMCIVSIIYFINMESIDVGDTILFGDISIQNILSAICIIGSIALALKLVFHIIFQSMQYKHITYTFYETHMVYEDDFLNQHRKNIEYSNIKEVEIRRTIIDRILGYGVIVIYTNAENSRNNGLVIYAIKNPKNAYDIIDDIVHKSKDAKVEVKKENETKVENKVSSENAEVQVENSGTEAKLTNAVKEEKQNNISVEEYSSDSERQKRIEENKKEEEEFLESLKNVKDESENI